MKAKKIFISILCLLLVAVSIFSICFLCVDGVNAWIRGLFSSEADGSDKDPDAPSEDNSGSGVIEDNTAGEVFAVSDTGTIMREGGVYEMPESITVIPRTFKIKTRDMDGAAGGAIGGATTGGTTSGGTTSGDIDNDVSTETSSGEITLVASLKNSYIKNADFNFTYSFENSNSAWANGKQVANYIGMQQSYDSEIQGGQVRLRLKEAFVEPIIVKATLEGSDAFATCKVIYLQRTDIDTVSLGGSDATDEANIECAVSYGTGTVKGDVTLKSAMLTLDGSFIDKVKNYLNFDVTFKAYKFDSTSKVEASDKYITVTDGTLQYSMFISGFDSLTQSQKDAVYYAWDKAYTAYGSNNNIYIDIALDFGYKGNVIYTTDKMDELGGAFSGYLYASELTHDVILDGEVIL